MWMIDIIFLVLYALVMSNYANRNVWMAHSSKKEVWSGDCGPCCWFSCPMTDEDLKMKLIWSPMIFWRLIFDGKYLFKITSMVLRGVLRDYWLEDLHEREKAVVLFWVLSSGEADQDTYVFKFSKKNFSASGRGWAQARKRKEIP